MKELQPLLTARHIDCPVGRKEVVFVKRMAIFVVVVTILFAASAVVPAFGSVESGPWPSADGPVWRVCVPTPDPTKARPKRDVFLSPLHRWDGIP